MDTLNRLEEYSGQTTDELIALEGKYRTDSLVLAFEEALYLKEDRIGMLKLTEEEKVILAIEALEREVNNGGYKQFFFNSSNEFTPFVVDALIRVGYGEIAELTKRAIACLGIEGSITAGVIDQIINETDDERDHKLSDCDDKYYETAGDLSGSLFEYIKKNRDRIHLQE